jgi:Fe-S oxidoreductase
VYTNYIRVDRGKAAVRVLEALGIDVEVPEVPGSGRAPLSQGMITQAEQKAKAVWESLRDPVHDGKEIVVIEPTDLAMFERRYEKFLSEEEALSLRESTTEVMNYIRQVLEAKSTLPNWLRPGDQQAVAYHSHCQQRTLDLERPTVRLLESLGYDVETSSAECCGMAGSFGYKSEYYELSMKVGDELQEEMAEMKAPQRTVVASGTSCKEQLQALLDEPVLHPIQLIAPQT